MNSASAVLEMSAARAGANPRLARMSRQAQGEYEAIVSLMDFWKKTFQSSSAISSEMLKTLLRAIKALIARIAALFGVAMQTMARNQSQGNEPGNETGKEPPAELKDVKFVGEKDKVEAAAAMAQETGEKLIEAAAQSASLEGDKGIVAALAKMEADLRVLQTQHDEAVQALQPMVQAAAASVGLVDAEEAFRKFVNNEDGVRQLVDPRNELQPHLTQISECRTQIDGLQKVFCTMAGAHIKETGRRDAVAPFLSPGRLDYLTVRVEDIAKNSANQPQFDQNIVAGNGDSGNNLVQPELISDEDRAQELPPKASMGLPAAPPAGVSRFAGLSRQSVGGFDEADEQEALAQQEHAQKE